MTVATMPCTDEPFSLPQDQPEFDFSLLDPILEQYKGQKGTVIPILQRAQGVYGYLPKPVLNEIARRTNTPVNQLYGVATFYSQFHLKRRGKHLVRVCDGTACHVRGSARNLETLEKETGVAAGTTSPDYRFTLEIVYCLGSCGLAPVAVVDDKVHANLAADALVKRIGELS